MRTKTLELLGQLEDEIHKKISDENIRETHSMMNIIQNKISGLRGSVMDSSVRTSGRGKHLDVSAEPCYKRMNNHHHHAA